MPHSFILNQSFNAGGRYRLASLAISVCNSAVLSSSRSGNNFTMSMGMFRDLECLLTRMNLRLIKDTLSSVTSVESS